METSFITPIQPWQAIGGISADSAQDTQSVSAGGMFQDIFQNAIQDVRNTESNLQSQQYLLSTGQINDPHTVQIAASEAQLATNMLVQLRNKALDAYNELMRISL